MIACAYDTPDYLLDPDDTCPVCGRMLNADGECPECPYEEER